MSDRSPVETKTFMKFKVLIRVRDKDGNIKEKSKVLPALSKRDAIHLCAAHKEIAIRRHGKANVISVNLHEVQEDNLSQ